MTVHGLILAAGASTRMGRPKALLTLENEYFVVGLVRRLVGAGCGTVAVVMGPHADLIEPHLPADAIGVRHLGWRAGMRSSLRVGVEALPLGPVLLTHVDRPRIESMTLERLIAAAGEQPVVPCYRGRPGHPVLLPASLRTRLLDTDDLPLRDLLAPLETRTLHVEDPGVVLNINTPDDYARLTRSRA